MNDLRPVSRLYPLRPSLFPHVPPFVQFLPVAGTVEFIVDPPEEMREMLWMVPAVPWHTISNSAELNGFTVSEVSFWCNSLIAYTSFQA